MPQIFWTFEFLPYFLPFIPGRNYFSRGETSFSPLSANGRVEIGFSPAETQVCVYESRSVHCFAHCLNLCLQDASKMCNLVRDCISVVKDIVQLISNSRKRNATFDAIKKETSPSTPNLRPLGPTCWTVRTATFESVLLNYAILIDTFEEISTSTRDEHGAKAA